MRAQLRTPNLARFLHPASTRKVSSKSETETLTNAISPVLICVASLTANERSELSTHEAVIHRGWQGFLQVGQALSAIRDLRLYRGEYKTFELYCQKRWMYQRSYAYGLINAATIAAQLSAIADIPKPSHESQIRPLVGLEPDEIKKVWIRAASLARGRPLLAKYVKLAKLESIRKHPRTKGSENHSPSKTKANTKSRPTSPAAAHHIASGIILFNFFTDPGVTPFARTNESVNTQVMLITDPAHVPGFQEDGADTLYWLDYDQLSKGGFLSFALHASFDANELPPAANGTRAYFVPDGCAACHGANPNRSLVNYLDTDHWFDRLDTDFLNLKTNGQPLLVDAKTNDTNSPAYIIAFDAVRRFNAEADELVQKAQPAHDEALASKKWLALHGASTKHFLPLERAIGKDPLWSDKNSDDIKALDALNTYCFRCHGTVKFSVFNRQAMATPEMKTTLEQRLKADAAIGIRMPPDRDLPEDLRRLILRILIP